LTPVSLFPSPLSSQRPPRSGTGACPYNSPLPIPYFLLPTPHSLLPIHSSPVTLSSRLFSLDSCLSFPVSALQPTPSAGRHRGLPLQLPTPHSLLPTTYSPLPTTYYLLPTPYYLSTLHQSPSLLVSFLLTPVSLFPSPLSSQRPPRSGTGACPYNSPLPIPYFLLPTPHSLLPIHSSPVTLSSRLFSLDSCLSFPVSALQPTPSAGRHRGLPLQLPTPHSLLPTTYSLFTSHPLFSSLFS